MTTGTLVSAFSGGAFVAANVLSSSINTNTDRAKILEASTQVLNRSYTTPYRFAVNQNKVIHGGVNYAANKDRDFFQHALHPFGPIDQPGGYKNIILSFSEDLVPPPSCKDDLIPNQKKKYSEENDNFFLIFMFLHRSE